MAKYKKDKKEDDDFNSDDLDSSIENEDWEAEVAKPVSDEIIIKKEEVKPKAVVVKKQINYAISGLSNAIKIEALKMLADGVDVKIVASKYGIAPSDISIMS